MKRIIRSCAIAFLVMGGIFEDTKVEAFLGFGPPKDEKTVVLNDTLKVLDTGIKETTNLLNVLEKRRGGQLEPGDGDAAYAGTEIHLANLERCLKILRQTINLLLSKYNEYLSAKKASDDAAKGGNENKISAATEKLEAAKQHLENAMKIFLGNTFYVLVFAMRLITEFTGRVLNKVPPEFDVDKTIKDKIQTFKTAVAAILPKLDQFKATTSQIVSLLELEDGLAQMSEEISKHIENVLNFTDKDLTNFYSNRDPFDTQELDQVVTDMGIGGSSIDSEQAPDGDDNGPNVNVGTRLRGDTRDNNNRNGSQKKQGRHNRSNTNDRQQYTSDDDDDYDDNDNYNRSKAKNRQQYNNDDYDDYDTGGDEYDDDDGSRNYDDDEYGQTGGRNQTKKQPAKGGNRPITGRGRSAVTR